MQPPDDRMLAALDRLTTAAVGVTALALAETAAAHDLTLAQWRALVVISASDGLRAGEVASRIGMSRPSMSRLVRRLQRRGVVFVAEDPDDRRATILRATPAGVAMRVATMARRRTLMAEALAARRGPLPDELGGALDAIADALERHA
jgi:DNA-binding MarR family transcriptional regulator